MNPNTTTNADKIWFEFMDHVTQTHLIVKQTGVDFHVFESVYNPRYHKIEETRLQHAHDLFTAIDFCWAMILRRKNEGHYEVRNS